MAKIVYRQMPAPRELPQQIPAPRPKLGCKSPRVGQIFGANSGRCAGRMVMDEIDTCIIVTELGKQMNPSQRSHFSLTSFRFFRPAQNFVAHTKPKETFFSRRTILSCAYKECGGFELRMMASSRDIIWRVNLTVVRERPVIMFLRSFLIAVICQENNAKNSS